MTPNLRPSVRAIILDEDDRILLCRFVFPHPAVPEQAKHLDAAFDRDYMDRWQARRRASALADICPDTGRGRLSYPRANTCSNRYPSSTTHTAPDTPSTSYATAA